jgi:hypothetical protein
VGSAAVGDVGGGGLGPYERLGGGIVSGQIAVDAGNQPGHSLEYATPDLLTDDLGEEATISPSAIPTAWPTRTVRLH